MPREQQSLALNALGDPTRRAILESLTGGERAVGSIAAELPVSRPAVSKHLKILRGAGLVTARSEGRKTIYRLDRNGVAGLRAYFDSLWETALPRFRLVAENLEEKE